MAVEGSTKKCSTELLGCYTSHSPPLGRVEVVTRRGGEACLFTLRDRLASELQLCCDLVLDFGTLLGSSLVVSDHSSPRMPSKHLARITHTKFMAYCVIVACLSWTSPANGQAYQQLMPPPNILPNDLTNSIGDQSVPTWSPSPANALTMPGLNAIGSRPPTTFFDNPGTNNSEDQFDAFTLSADDKLKLRPWNTFGIPIGSWGDKATWDADQLNSTTIERFRKAFVQKVQLNGGYVWRDQDDDLGYSHASAAATMVVPLGSTDSLLVFTPKYRVDWIDGPASLDVPSRLQSATLDIGWRRVFNEQWSTIIGIRPGYFNDFDADDKGKRLGGLAIINYVMIPKQLTFTFGVVYLDRNDTNLLPAVGLNLAARREHSLRFELSKTKDCQADQSPAVCVRGLGLRGSLVRRQHLGSPSQQRFR